MTEDEARTYGVLPVYTPEELPKTEHVIFIRREWEWRDSRYYCTPPTEITDRLVLEFNEWIHLAERGQDDCSFDTYAVVHMLADQRELPMKMLNECIEWKPTWWVSKATSSETLGKRMSAYFQEKICPYFREKYSGIF